MKAEAADEGLGAGKGKADSSSGCTRAIVLFADNTQLKWLQFLEPGFRHCLVAVQFGGGWVIMDPLSHKTALSVVGGLSAHELVRWYESQGLRALPTAVREAPAKLAPLGPATCVEAVKRVLGIHARSVVTPRQLFNYLNVDRNIDLDLGQGT